MEFTFFTEIFDFLRDPFYCFGIIVFCFVMLFSHYLAKNGTKITEQFEHDETAISLSNVSVILLAKTIGTQRGWLKANVIFAPNSIFVLGGMKPALSSQYYSRHKPQPKRQVLSEKNFIPIDEMKWDGDNLIIRYISPHWHKAKCTLVLKKL